MIIRMRFHIVRRCIPLSSFMVSLTLRCHYLDTLLLTLASFQSMEGLDSWAWTAIPFLESPSSSLVCVLQGWPLNSSGSFRCNICHIPCRGLCKPFLFSYLLGWGSLFHQELTYGSHYFNAALIPKGVHTLSIPSLRPLTYSRLCIRGRGSSTGEWGFCESVFLTKSVGKPLTWKTSWGAEVQLSWRWSHRFGWLCLTHTLTPF